MINPKLGGGRAIFKAVNEHGLPAVVVTPTSIYGPHDYYPSLLGQAIIDIYRRKVPALTPGGYDFVPVSDVVNGTIAALERGRVGEKYLLSGKFMTVKELSALVGDVAGKKTIQKVLPMWLLKFLIPFFKMQSQLSGKAPIFTEESLISLIHSNPNVSSAKAEKELGYIKTPPHEAMEHALTWYREEGIIK